MGGERQEAVSGILSNKMSSGPTITFLFTIGQPRHGWLLVLKTPSYSGQALFSA